MYTLHCTQKLLDRIKQPVVDVPPAPTTSLGNWYAHAMFWTPQVALLVNERTLLPVLMPLAPAATLPMRFPTHLAIALRELGINAEFVASEIEAMSEAAIAKTANRRVLGTMNEFAFLADGYRQYLESPDLLLLSLKLSDTPCGPLKGNSPARVLREVVAGGRA
ncbi:MAG: hypothetical protein H7201_02140 [Candidatus Saccharibacteria bacterium]|nr:hypothetical protein [Microbacteriaceae bacterium]